MLDYQPLEMSLSPSAVTAHHLELRKPDQRILRSRGKRILDYDA
jgi:hypothetical protein